MSPFLHTPARSPQQVFELVEGHREEDQHLEFKPTIVEEEVVGGVAAFANGLGGDLVIGVSHDKDPATGLDRAGGWSDNDSKRLAEKEDHVRNSLRLKLLPGELYDLLELRVHRVEEGPPQKHVIVVNVPPLQRGVAAFRNAVDPDRALYKFPVRVESHTRYCTIEEVMQITGGQRRALYLKARELFNEGKQEPDKDKRLLVFASPIDVRKGAFSAEFPLHQPEGSDATLVEVTPDTIVLAMRGAEVDVSFMGGQDSIPRWDKVGAPPEQALTIPLDLVRAIWRAGPPQHRLQLAVEGIVEWRRDQWSLVVGRTE